MIEKWWMDCPKEEKRLVREWCKYQTANVRMLRRREITVDRYIYIRKLLAEWLDRIERRDEKQGTLLP